MRHLSFVIAAIVALSTLLGCAGKTISPSEGRYRSQDIPLNVSATDSLKGQVAVTWDSVAGAGGYLVYRADGPDDSFLLVSPEITALTFADTTALPDSTYFYCVRTLLSSGDTSMPSATDAGRRLQNGMEYTPAFSASDGAFGDRVELAWARPTAGMQVIISRNIPGDTFWTALRTTTVDTAFADTGAPPGPLTYRLAAVYGSTGFVQNYYDNGYRTINDTEFFVEMNKTVKHSEAKLTKLGSLGSEQVDGDTTGTLTYNAAMSGLNVNVKLEYVDYRDFYLTLNGRQSTSITNVLAQSGTVTDTVFVTGLYPGAVVYDISVNGGKPVGGTYTVVQQGKPPATIQFSAVSQYVL